MNLGDLEAVWSKLPLATAVVQTAEVVANRERLQDIFDRSRGRCYDKQLSFPSLVELVKTALLEHGGSGNQSFERAREAGEAAASKVAMYGKLGRIPLAVSEAFLAELSIDLRTLVPREAYRQSPACLRSMNTVTLDGKAIKRVAKRLKPLRQVAGGVLGGRALVAMHNESGLAIGMHTDEDGDANDVRFVPQLLPQIREQLPGPLLFLADSGFCDLNRFREFTEEDNHFLVRSHPKVGFHPDSEAHYAVREGSDRQGRTLRETWGWLGASTHRGRRYVRQITLIRPGEKDVVLYTDLLDPEQYPAEELLDHYLSRWGIEQMFQKVTEVFGLQRLIGSTPKATIFQFAFCLVLYNLIQVIRSYVAAHQERPVESLSTYNLFLDVHRQLTAWSVLDESGLPLVIPTPGNLAELAVSLHELLGNQWTNRWIKAVNKKRRPHTPKPRKRTHGSAYRIVRDSKAAPPAPDG